MQERLVERHCPDGGDRRRELRQVALEHLGEAARAERQPEDLREDARDGADADAVLKAEAHSDGLGGGADLGSAAERRRQGRSPCLVAVGTVLVEASIGGGLDAQHEVFYGVGGADPRVGEGAQAVGTGRASAILSAIDVGGCLPARARMTRLLACLALSRARSPLGFISAAISMRPRRHSATPNPNGLSG